MPFHLTSYSELILGEGAAMKDIHFRKARKEDINGILAIYQYSIEHDDATYITKCPSWREWDRDHDKDQRIVAVIDNNIVGFVAVAAEKQFTEELKSKAGLVSIYVDHRYRHSGIGTMLLQCLIRYNSYLQMAGRNGAYRYLHSRIFTNNQLSIDLHKKVGFKNVQYCEKSLKKNGRLRDTYVFERRTAVL